VNYRWLRAIHGLAGNAVLDTLMKAVAQDLIFVLFVALAVVGLLRLRARMLRDLLWTGAALALSFALGLAAAALHPEARPFTTHPDLHPLIAHGAGQSFPSDHATASFAIAFAIMVFLSRRVGAVVLAGAVLIGFARVYAGLHYPGDILGSVVVAVAGVGAVALLRARLPADSTGAQAEAG